MSSYRQLLYHLVFRSKDSQPTIKQDHIDQLYTYIMSIIKHKNSHMYRINSLENHLHILTDLHPSIALADFMREVKVSSSLWIKSGNLFPACYLLYCIFITSYGTPVPSTQYPVPHALI